MSVYPWQNRQWQQLMSSIESGRLPHAMLLHGPEGIGLSHFSRVLAGRLLCDNIRNNTVCGKCRACVLLASDNHPDLLIVQPEEAGKQIKVEQVRELIEFVQLKSHYGKYKLAIIEPANQMNHAAANALLKTLEEPPDASLLILNTHQLQRLPVTIRSRCQQLHFTVTPDDSVVNWLQGQLDGEQDARLLLQQCPAPLAALDMAREDRLQLRDQLLDDLARISEPATDPVTVSKDWSDAGSSSIDWLQQLFMDMLKLNITPEAPGISNRDRVEQLRRLSNGLDLRQLLACSQLLARIYSQYHSTVSYNLQALLEEFVVFWHLNKTGGGLNQ
ncbi:MAG: DNA polymerase III subunit delta' [Proteobacteria bacterium]|nr:DNA polymerase III subunit delta' [Pseudomonadota bacterium]